MACLKAQPPEGGPTDHCKTALGCVLGHKSFSQCSKKEAEFLTDEVEAYGEVHD